MKLKKLMELSSDDTWFCLYANGCYGRKFYNADFLLRDEDVMKILKPLLVMKVAKISIERLPVPGSGMKTPLIAVRLEDK